MFSLFQFTFIALMISGMVLRGVRRHSYSVRWSSREYEGLAYEVGPQNFRGRALGLVLRFPVPKGLRFLLRPETRFDRLAKRLWLATEPQLGDEIFDARFFVECEDAALIDSARAHPDLLKLMSGLQARLKAGGSKLIELRCEAGKLDLVIERDMTGGAPSAEEMVLKWIQPLLPALRSQPPRRDQPLDRGFAARLIFVTIFMIGVVGGMSVSEFFTERMVGDFTMFAFSVPYSLAALTVALLAALRWLGRTPGRHRVLAACLLVGVPGFLSCGTLIVRGLDLSLAQPMPELIALDKAWLSSHSTRRGGISHRVAFDGKDHRTYGTSPILLSDDEYERLHAAWGSEEQRPATLVWHPGALGLPWIEFSLARPNADAPTTARQEPGR